MDFTREPIVETIITPKEGCKLVVRSSKSTGQEEYFVDAVEVVSFGNALFFRTMERPKAFLVPASDYEVLEVREARMVLKNVGVERTIKIGGGKATKEPAEQKVEPIQPDMAATGASEAGAATEPKEGRVDKKRDKRRHSRRRRGRDEVAGEEGEAPAVEETEGMAQATTGERKSEAPMITPGSSIILPPPATLISETLARYKEDALFKGAFYVKEAQAEASDEEGEEALPPIEPTSGDHPDDLLEAMAMQDVSLEPSEYGTFGLADEEQNNWQMPFPEEDVEPKE